MFQSLIEVNKNDSKPVFLQLADQLRDQIIQGTVQPGVKLPGSRKLAEYWQVHRKTVIAAIDELLAQGWLSTKPGIGTFVSQNIEQTEPQNISYPERESTQYATPAIPQTLARELVIAKEMYHLDDGLPDPRLAPSKELARAYKTAITSGNLYARYGYADTKGHIRLREILCSHLMETRNMTVTPEQIMVTRGVTQALYLSILSFLQKGDKAAVTAPNWESGNMNFTHNGAELIKVRTDEHGMDTGHLEELLQDHQLKMVYVTPHHQYPTTVIMPAYRRIKLHELARRYGFLIFEDDYDYDFHYNSRPLMPLASAAHGDHILYTGSFTKAISPAFRVGYLVASKEQINLLAHYRRIVDRQGDTLLEIALAELLELGILQRYLRKNRKIYQARRDLFCSLLDSELDGILNYSKPEGGMSVWATFDKRFELGELARKASEKGLYFYGGKAFSQIPNSTRLGFASSNDEELRQSVEIIRQLTKY